MFVGTRGTEKPQCQRSSMLTKRTHAGEPKSFPSQNIQKPEVNGEKRDIGFFKLLHINRAGLSVTNKTNKQKKKTSVWYASIFVRVCYTGNTFLLRLENLSFII